MPENLHRKCIITYNIYIHINILGDYVINLAIIILTKRRKRNFPNFIDGIKM